MFSLTFVYAKCEGTAAHRHHNQKKNVQSHFVRMSQMLNIGKKFEDFSSLEIAIQQHQKEENVQCLVLMLVLISDILFDLILYVPSTIFQL